MKYVETKECRPAGLHAPVKVAYHLLEVLPVSPKIHFNVPMGEIVILKDSLGNFIQLRYSLN